MFARLGQAARTLPSNVDHAAKAFSTHVPPKGTLNIKGENNVITVNVTHIDNNGGSPLNDSPATRMANACREAVTGDIFSKAPVREKELTPEQQKVSYDKLESNCKRIAEIRKSLVDNPQLEKELNELESATNELVEKIYHYVPLAGNSSIVEEKVQKYDLLSDVADAKKMQEKTMKKLMKNKAKMTEKLEHTQEELGHVKKENAHLQKENIHLHKQVHNLEEKVELLNAENASTNKEIKDLKETIDRNINEFRDELTKIASSKVNTPDVQKMLEKEERYKLYLEANNRIKADVEILQKSGAAITSTQLENLKLAQDILLELTNTTENFARTGELPKEYPIPGLKELLTGGLSRKKIMGILLAIIASSLTIEGVKKAFEQFKGPVSDLESSVETLKSDAEKLREKYNKLPADSPYRNAENEKALNAIDSKIAKREGHVKFLNDSLHKKTSEEVVRGGEAIRKNRINRKEKQYITDQEHFTEAMNKVPLINKAVVMSYLSYSTEIEDLAFRLKSIGERISELDRKIS